MDIPEKDQFNVLVTLVAQSLATQQAILEILLTMSRREISAIEDGKRLTQDLIRQEAESILEFVTQNWTNIEDLKKIIERK